MDNILDRISKLLAKAKSTTNPHEAGIFADKAAELLAKHNLDEAMLAERDAEREEGPIGRHQYPGRSPDRWRELILMGYAELYFCKLIISRKSRKKGHEFIGREHNVKVAILMAEYLIATTKRLAREHSPHKADQTDFRKGCGLTLYERMKKLAQSEQAIPDAPSGQNALVLRNNEATAIEEWMFANMNLGRAKKSKAMRIGASGAAGMKAGHTVSLNRQVRETRSNRMIGRG
jgi:hypothetical protein